MSRTRALASATFVVLFACSEPPCADDEQKIGSTCHRLPTSTAPEAPEGQAPVMDDGGGASPATSDAAVGAPQATPTVDAGIARTRDLVALAAGEGTTYALWSDWSASVWGQTNHHESFGAAGEKSTRATPLQGVEGARQLVLSATYACMRSLWNDVRCWGVPVAWLSGRGVPRRVPKKMDGLDDAQELAISATHACARTSSGAVACWGYAAGNSALPPATRDDTVAFIPGSTDAVEVEAGHYFSCFRTSTRIVRCWGLNDSGQLGDGTKSDRSELRDVSGLENVTEIGSGSGHSCARLEDGSVSCWGRNHRGQLGGGPVADSTLPVRTGIADAVALAMGLHHACALHKAGTVSCWGNNEYGQVGDGTTNARNTPLQIAGLTSVTEIVAGWNHTCARIVDGSVRCWGRNDVGQLGDGTTEDRASPVAVLGLQ